MKDLVVLIEPNSTSVRPRIPLALLFLADSLIKNGFRVKILDLRVEELKDFVLDPKEVLFVGVTVWTGSPIKKAKEVSLQIKSIDKNVPIVWGSIHPTLLPEQTLAAPYVDYVIRNEGEETIVEFAKALQTNKGIESIKGLSYKRGGEIVNNCDREWVDMNKTSHLPYHLIDLPKYNADPFPYHSSRGCPYRCVFCYNLRFNKGGYREKKAENVLDEIEYLYKELSVRKIHFIEDNFFTNRLRVEKICRGLIERNIKIEWMASCRLNYVANYSDEFLQLIKDSGCFEFAFGAESGDAEVLKLIKKDLTIQEMELALEKCKRFNIIPRLSFMCGFPGEKLESIIKTLELIKHLKVINSSTVVNGLFLCTPYPGTPIYEEVTSKGYSLPKNLDEWGDFQFFESKSYPWLEKRFQRKIEAMTTVVRIIYFNQMDLKKHFKSRLLYLAYACFNFPFETIANFRWKHNWYSFSLDCVLWSKVRDLYLEQK